jgi:hypothetical protein
MEGSGLTCKHYTELDRFVISLLYLFVTDKEKRFIKATEGLNVTNKFSYMRKRSNKLECLYPRLV